MMTDSEVQVFIDGIKNYFMTVSDSKAVVGTPYLINANKSPHSDYTGVIEISGIRKGKVYVLAARAMLRHLLLSLGEKNISSELIIDIVGEVANTISGNVREQFGSQFVISTPVIIEGKNDAIEDVNQAFSVPFRWKSYTGYLVICLK
ncbi:MAG: chemotaxis protein CheX [Candidatus Endobugula sp.]|jgi:chemotaxis protein CheX